MCTLASSCYILYILRLTDPHAHLLPPNPGLAGLLNNPGANNPGGDGMGGPGGMGGLAGLLNNPALMGMAAQMMQNPAFANMCVRRGGVRGMGWGSRVPRA